MRRRDQRNRSKHVLKWMLLLSFVVGLVAPAGPIAGAQAASALPEDGVQSFNVATNSSGLKDGSVPKDLNGHWSESIMSEWAGRGLIQGFADGTIRPDETITRVQFVALVNRLFALRGGDAVKSFVDVSSKDWFASDVAAAVSAGYVNGYPDNSFRPGKPLQRVEAVTMLTKLVPAIAGEAGNRSAAFQDWSAVPDFGRLSLEAAIASGLLQGFPDNTVRPTKALTRAEAVALLERVRKNAVETPAGGFVPHAYTVSEAGVYGPAAGLHEVGGNLEISSPGTTLRNIVVNGDLTILPSVGDGDVFLSNIRVRGKTFVRGGGENSVHIDNSSLGIVVIERVDGKVRVVAEGTTIIEAMDVQSDSIIETADGSTAAIGEVIITSSGEVVLSGVFSHVEIKGDVKLTVASGSIDNLTVDESAAGAEIQLQKGANVDHMTLRGATEIKGEGTIGLAIVDASGIAFQTEPVAKEVTERGGGSGGAGGAGGGIGGGGFSGGGFPPGPVVTPAPTVTPVPTATQGPTATPSPTSTQGPTATPGPTSTSDPTPTSLPVVAVEAAVSQSGTTGFRLTFSVSVPGLTASDITLLDSEGHAVNVGMPATLDGGAAYRIPAVLSEGSSYSLSLAKTGYHFGGNLSFTVPVTPQPPVTVTASVYGISASGFSLRLNGPVDGLTSEHFSLVRKIDNTSISAGQPTTGDGGLSYSFPTALQEGETYGLFINKSGYDFGEAVTIFVPVTDPGIITVDVAITTVLPTGFALSLYPPVPGLAASDFSITSTRSGAVVSAANAATSDGGSSYSITAALGSGESYTVGISKSGYSFGAATVISVPAGDIGLQPAISRISTSGFILTLDKPVPDLDALNFILTSGASEVGIDMLSPVRDGLAYEVWSTLSRGETYSLELDKEGYVFAEGAVEWIVEPTLLQSETAWITRSGFKLELPNDTAYSPLLSYELLDEAGLPVTVKSVTTEDGGRSILVQADLPAAGVYRYVVELDNDRYIEGTVTVPEAIPVSKYTTFDPSNAGVIVHFELPIRGLELEDFHLSDTVDQVIAIDSATTTDGGKSYFLESSAMQYQRLKLNISRNGYDFGESVYLIRTTLNPWYGGVGPNNFMAGLNPAVPGLTADNFKVVNDNGENIEITNVDWDTRQGIYIVSYKGERGKTSAVSVVKEGYDFGAPKMITLEPQYRVNNVSYDGFDFVLNPPLLIPVSTGFEVKKSDGSRVSGISISTLDGGATYQFRGKLAPGDYWLHVNASLSETSFYFYVPVVATISVDSVSNTGVRAALDFPLKDLEPHHFLLTRTDTGEEIAIGSVTTTDGGYTYQLTASLAGGSYNLKLQGHLPEEGVAFQAEATTQAGPVALGRITLGGFDLQFANAVPGLLPGNLELLDGQGHAVTGLTLTSSDNGLTYRVNARLSSGADYSLSLRKDYVDFGGSVSVRVPLTVTGTVVETTRSGFVSIAFDPPMPQMETGVGIIFKDSAGNRFYPNAINMSGAGARYQFKFSGVFELTQGTAYTAELDVDGYAMSPVAFALPAGYAVTGITSTGVDVTFDSLLPGLLRGNFTLTDALGADVRITSATTTDGGASYRLSAALTPGQFYTLSVKPGQYYQQYMPISFAVVKTITASLSELKRSGFILTFSERIKDLKLSELIVRGADGQRLPTDAFILDMSTKDQGLSYQITMPPLPSAEEFTVELNREELRFAAPVTVRIPDTGSLWLYSTAQDQIIFGITPTSLPLTMSHVKLTDSRGRAVAATLQQVNDTFYSLLGDFETAETYYLAIAYPGLDFGSPLAIGLIIKSDAVMTSQNQDGFKLWMFPPLPGLQPTDIEIKDEAGNMTPVQAVETLDGGVTYNVKASLSSGHTYSLAINKSGYLVRINEKISLVSRATALDQLSLSSLTLSLSEKTSLNYSEVTLHGSNGASVPITGFVSWDGGYSYEISATLSPDTVYEVRVAKAGFDFGRPKAFSIQSVGMEFGELVNNSGGAFLLQLDHAIPEMRTGDFKLRRASDGRLMSVILAETEDGGLTYRLEADFLGGEKYTILPVKDGYDFGEVIAVDVPVFARAALLGAGSSEVVIGLSPAVPGLSTEHFTITEASGSQVTVLAVTTTDGGATYQVQADFRGGATYNIALQRSGFVFQPVLTVTLPEQIAIKLDGVKSTGIRVALMPGVNGLSKDSFVLKDDQGIVIPVATAATTDRGLSYWLEASLEEGRSYNLALAAAGYSFGSPLNAYVPFEVNKSIEALGKDGFTVVLDAPVDLLNATNFFLLDGKGAALPVIGAQSEDGGATYAISAELAEGGDYSLHITRSGYDFGDGLTFVVPLPPLPEPEPPVTMTATDATNAGFILRFSDSVPGLTVDSIRITNAQGENVEPQNVRGLRDQYDDLNYRIGVPLTPGVVYTVELVEQEDGASAEPTEVYVTLNLNPRLESPTSEGFKLRFVGAGPGSLMAEAITVYGSDNLPVSVARIKPGAEAGLYDVEAKLEEGETYRVVLEQKAIHFQWQRGSDMYVPIKSSAVADHVGPSGFKLVFSAPVPGLAITLYTGNSNFGFSPESLVTNDGGLTYLVGVHFPYNSTLRVSLAKDGYALGEDFVVEHISLPPALLTAATDAGGRKITLEFDMALKSVPSNAPFSIKINNQWQSGVRAFLVPSDNTKVELTWSSTGAVITSASSAQVAFAGINRVTAINQTYLAPFSELEVANVATVEGFVSSFPNGYYANEPAALLKSVYGKTALETLKLLRDAGFAPWNYASAVRREYELSNADIIVLLHQSDTDVSTLFDILDSIGAHGSYKALTGTIIAAGYGADEIAPKLQSKSIQGRDAALLFKQAGVSAQMTADILFRTFDESFVSATAILKSAGYGRNELAAAVRSIFSLSNVEIAAAMASAGFTAGDVLTFMLEELSVTATDAAQLLIEAGFEAKAAGQAMSAAHSFGDAGEAAAALYNAWVQPLYVYGIVKSMFDAQSAAKAMLAAGIPSDQVAGAVKNDGDAPAIVISAMLSNGADSGVAAAYVADAWGKTPEALAMAMDGLASNGMTIHDRTTVLRELYGATIASAIAALSPSATGAEKQDMMSILVGAGYSRMETVKYYLDNVYGGRRGDTLTMLKKAGIPTDEGLNLIRQAFEASGATFTSKDGVDVFRQSYDRFTADEVLKALVSTFAHTNSGSVSAAEYAKAMSDSLMWDKMEIGKALVSRLGITLTEWVELERSDVFSARGCSCNVSTIVNDSKYLYPRATIEDITRAMSQTRLFTLTELVDGLVGYYQVSGLSGDSLSYLTAGLKSAGYPFPDIAAIFDAKGWSGWIRSFSRNGIAASEVAAYLKQISIADEEIVQRLEPYTLKDIALALRTELGKTEAEATALLSPHYFADDISLALVFAYGGNPVDLWIKTLKSQNASVFTVIYTITSRYSNYREASVVGPALVRAGYGVDEVMEGLLAYSSAGNMKETVRLLQQMYAEEQISLSRLLTASGNETPEAGIQFMKNAAFSIATIARALKEHYGLASGKASALLAAEYPNSIAQVLDGVNAAFEESFGNTVSNILEENGITTFEEAIPYLSRRGFSYAESIGAVKDVFGLTAGEAVKRMAAMGMGDSSALLTALSAVYNQSILKTVYERQLADGTSSFASGIEIGYRAGLNLLEIIRMAKEYYGISSGAAFHALSESGRFNMSEISPAIPTIYSTSDKQTITESLASKGLLTLKDAAPYLRTNLYDLQDIVRVGRDYYGLTAAQTTSELINDNYYQAFAIQTDVAYVYGQTLEQAMINSLDALGHDTFEKGIAYLHQQNVGLNTIVRAAKDYYSLKHGPAIYGIQQSGQYALSAILSEVAEVYGKPLSESVADVLANGGVSNLEDAVLFLQRMGYSMKDMVTTAKEQYGLAAGDAAHSLAAILGESSLELLQWTVSNVYSQSPGSAEPEEIVTGAVFADAILELKNAGVSLPDIARRAQSQYHLTSRDAANELIRSQLYNIELIVQSISLVYGQSADGIVAAMQSNGSSDPAVIIDNLRLGGIRLEEIMRAAKEQLGLKETELETYLLSKNVYDEVVVRELAAKMYGAEFSTATALLQAAIELHGIRTADGAIAFMRQANSPLKDIVSYLKVQYGVTASEATELLKPYYTITEIGLATTSVYSSTSGNLKYLSQVMSPLNVSNTPTGLAQFMYKQFSMSDIVSALHWFYGLDAAQMLQALGNSGIPKEQFTEAVVAFYGNETLFQYYAAMKKNGASARDIATEMEHQGQLKTVNIVYLAKLLQSLEYDLESIIRTVFAVYTAGRGTEATVAEHAEMFVALGYERPEDIVDGLRYAGYVNSVSYAFRIYRTITLALPNEEPVTIAKAMKKMGHNGVEILNTLKRLEIQDDSVVGLMKEYGYSALQAITFMSSRTSDDQMYWMIKNGYDLYDYMKYGGNNSVAILKKYGISANEMAIVLNRYGRGSFQIASALYNGGFTDLKVLIPAMMAGRSHRFWVLEDLINLEHWSKQEIAQTMLDEEVMSLAELAKEIRRFNEGRLRDDVSLKEVYTIIRAISAGKQQAFRDSLSSIERKAFDDNTIAIVTTVTTLRAGDFSVRESALLIQQIERFGYLKAGIMLGYSGYSISDLLGALWDVYRAEIGVSILKAMVGKSIGNVVTELETAYKIFNFVYRMVNVVVKFA